MLKGFVLYAVTLADGGYLEVEERSRAQVLLVKVQLLHPLPVTQGRVAFVEPQPEETGWWPTVNVVLSQCVVGEGLG